MTHCLPLIFKAYTYEVLELYCFAYNKSLSRDFNHISLTNFVPKVDISGNVKQNVNLSNRLRRLR